VNPESVSQQELDQHQNADQAGAPTSSRMASRMPKVTMSPRQYKLDLLTSMQESFQQEVAPRTQAIAQVALQRAGATFPNLELALAN